VGGGLPLAPPDVWLPSFTESGRDLVLRRIFDHLGITSTKSKASSPDSLMCRVLSQSLLQVVFSKSCYKTYAELPEDASDFTDARSNFDRFRSLAWVISENGKPIAKFKDGWMFRIGGDRIDLYSQYRSGWASVQSLASNVHEKLQMERDFPVKIRGLTLRDNEVSKSH